LAASRSEGVEARLNQIARYISTGAASLVGVGAIAIIYFTTSLRLQVDHHKVLAAIATRKQMYLLLTLVKTNTELHAAVGQSGHLHHSRSHY
jgi:hypothetical protein